MKKILTAFIVFTMTIGAMHLNVNAEAAKKVTLRMEGTEKVLYYDTVTTTASTVIELIKDVDAATADIDCTITESSYGSYLSGVNGENEMKFGGYDGWLFTVNGIASDSGMSNTTLNDGDSVVVYYADPFGTGFQMPVADTTAINDGIITFTSTDTVYDQNYNASTVINPVKGATVKWYNGNNYSEYVTDDNGQIKIKNIDLTNGNHKLQIEKYTDNGIPMVLRFEPDYSVAILNNNFNTDKELGDNSNIALYLFMIICSVYTVTSVVLRKKHA